MYVYKVSYYFSKCSILFHISFPFRPYVVGWWWWCDRKILVSRQAWKTGMCSAHCSVQYSTLLFPQALSPSLAYWYPSAQNTALCATYDLSSVKNPSSPIWHGSVGPTKQVQVITRCLCTYVRTVRRAIPVIEEYVPVPYRTPHYTKQYSTSRFCKRGNQ